MKILGVVSSPRYKKLKNFEFKKLLKSNDWLNSIYELGQNGCVSNSQLLLISAMIGAKKEGLEVEFIYPKDIIPANYDGIVFSTPVYFGDRSSNLNDIISKLNLKNKAVGIVSSGAKRNGGQETTNIYTLYECLNKGSLITGNGPPTAQYGGTGWAGNKTAIINDDFGIKTSFGTGKQVAKLTKLINEKNTNEDVNILILDFVNDEFLPEWINDKHNLNYLNMVNKNIKKCLACNICPNGDLTKEYKCILKNDDMKLVQSEIKNADCIIFYYNGNSLLLQKFIERSRFIRRNHFELSEKLYSSINVSNDINDIWSLKIMTNMLRHNMFGMPFYRNLGINNNKFYEYWNQIKYYTRKSKISRNKNKTNYKYISVGYDGAKINDSAYRD